MLTFARLRLRLRPDPCRRAPHSARHLVAAAASAVVIVVAASGCGSVAPAADTFALHEASTSAEDACAPSGAAICNRARDCAPFWFDRLYTSIATCTAVFTEKCVDRYRGEGAATKIADCSAAVGSLSCEELFDPVVITYLDPGGMIASCPVTPGIYADGERCLRDGDCTTGHCSWAAGSCGKCAAPGAPPALRKTGEACTSDGECASRWCSNGACGKVAKLGEACADRPCDLLAGLTCGSDARCRPFGTIPVGRPCMDFDLCDVGSTCVSSPKSSNSGTCEPSASAGVGEDCTRGCARELTCADGKCAAPTPGHPKSCATPSPASSQ